MLESTPPSPIALRPDRAAPSHCWECTRIRWGSGYALWEVHGVTLRAPELDLPNRKRSHVTTGLLLPKWKERTKQVFGKMVDLTGIEPVTSSMPWKRAPSCATGPLV